jgi:NodT family efflux transporter outer membrane factor (OMF) lipoprotein
MAVVRGILSCLAKTTAIAMMATAAGCAVGPDYHLPTDAVFDAPGAQVPFVGARGNHAVQKGELPPNWWHIYRSPDLDRLIADAIAENTDLRVADANLERSHAMVDLAKAAGQPKVGFEGGYERALLSAESYLSTAILPDMNLYTIGLTASYEVDLFGRIRRGIEAAQADDDAVEAARDWIRVSVVADVTRAYLEACTAGDELAVARKSVDLQFQSLAITRRLQEGGRASSLDMTRSKALVDQLESSIPAFEARRRNALYRLAVLTGKPPANFEKSLSKCVSAPPIRQPIPVGDGAALLRRRPDVRAAERTLAALTAEIGVATAELYPRVVLNASIGSADLTSDFLDRQTNDWAAGSGLSWQLNPSGPRAKIAVATALQKAQLARFDGVVLGALRDVEVALSIYSHDLRRRKSLAAARDEAAKAVADANLLQTDGRLGALASLDAERTLASAEAALAAIRAQIAQDQVTLFLALGGGWETPAPPLDSPPIVASQRS